MSIVDNYKWNTAIYYIAAMPPVVNGEAYIKEMLGWQQSSKLDVEEHYDKCEKSWEKIEKLQKKGRTIFDDDLGSELRLAILHSVNLYMANLNNAYSVKVVNKLKSLTESVLKGLNKSEARKRFAAYKQEMDFTADYDKATIIYLSNYFEVLANEVGVSVNIDSVVDTTQKMLEEFNIDASGVDFDEIVDNYPVDDFGQILGYFQTAMPTIAK